MHLVICRAIMTDGSAFCDCTDMDTAVPKIYTIVEESDQRRILSVNGAIRTKSSVCLEHQPSPGRTHTASIAPEIAVNPRVRNGGRPSIVRSCIGRAFFNGQDHWALHSIQDAGTYSFSEPWACSKKKKGSCSKFLVLFFSHHSQRSFTCTHRQQSTVDPSLASLDSQCSAEPVLFLPRLVSTRGAKSPCSPPCPPRLQARVSQGVDEALKELPPKDRNIRGARGV